MSVHFTPLFQATNLPTNKDIKLAKVSSKLLSRMAGKHPAIELHLDDQPEVIQLPASAFNLLVYALNQMANGNALAISPIHAELTTQEAAAILDISRPHLIKLLDAKKIPYHRVGTHRKIRFQDLMNYKEKIDAIRHKILDELAQEAQELDMGY